MHHTSPDILLIVLGLHPHPAYQDVQKGEAGLEAKIVVAYQDAHLGRTGVFIFYYEGLQDSYHFPFLFPTRNIMDLKCTDQEKYSSKIIQTNLADKSLSLSQQILSYCS